MPNNPGTKLQKNERWSEEYDGFIERNDGSLRKPFTWVNKNGKVRNGNRYYIIAPCGICSKPTAVEKGNYKKHPQTYCSSDCRYASKVAPEGRLRAKRGGSLDSHVLIKKSDHPHAKNGYVPEHRLVMESMVGRHLDPEERVHHINCVKSDNRPENLALCKNDQAHFLAHGSLNKCVAALIDMGVLSFDQESLTYQIPHGIGLPRLLRNDKHSTERESPHEH